jgi:uncharacterized membrane protein
MVLLYLILVGGVVLVVGLAIVGALFRQIAARPTPPTQDACDVLGERYLRGEITTQEYRVRRDALR